MTRDSPIYEGQNVFSDEDSEEKMEEEEGSVPGSKTTMVKIENASVTLDQLSIGVADKNTFSLFQLFPLGFRMYKNFVPDVGAVRLVKQMAGRCNYVCYVSAKSGKFAQNNVMVFDLEHNQEVEEITTPSRFGEITNIQASYYHLAVFTKNRLIIFNFPTNIGQIRSEEIRANEKGISAMSYDPSNHASYLAYPGFDKGTIQILSLSNLSTRESRSPVVIQAHESEIAQVALNCQGTLVASGSVKGTIIRVFDARNKGILYELRRGTTPAHLQCMAFSPCSNYLAVASDKGTLHLFGIREAEPQKQKNMLERNCGTGSLLKIKVDRDVLALGFNKQTSNTFQGIVAICSDGTYCRYPFTKDGTGKYRHDTFAFAMLDEVKEVATFYRTAFPIYP